MKFRIYNYDVWGNEEEGWEVNNRFRTDFVVEIPENSTDSQIVDALISSGYANPSLVVDKLHFDGNDYVIYIDWADDGRPEIELVREESNATSKA